MSDIFFSDAGVYEDDPPSIRDVRREQMLPPAAASPMKHQTARMDAILDGICRRLLEQATAGRLTWEGDAIVRIEPQPRRHPRPAIVRAEAGGMDLDLDLDSRSPCEAEAASGPAAEHDAADQSAGMSTMRRVTGLAPTASRSAMAMHASSTAASRA